VGVLVVSGTGTSVGKTVVTAAIAALAIDAGRRVAVVKPAQTGVADDEPGDLDVIRALVGDTGRLTTHELARYPDPLAPETAARRSGRPAVRPPEIAAAVSELRARHDLVLVEGAGGLLVRFDPTGATIADVAWAVGAPVLLVADPGLGTLNATALTAEALARRRIECAGVVVGRWPSDPDLATRCNLIDLPVAAGAPLKGALPDGIGDLRPERFLSVARGALSPSLDGDFKADVFTAEHTA
jgi:dethiobiotin synthetase